MEIPCIFSGKLAFTYKLHITNSSPAYKMDENRGTHNKEKEDEDF